jgi:hypothetical protein
LRAELAQLILSFDLISLGGSQISHYQRVDIGWTAEEFGLIFLNSQEMFYFTESKPELIYPSTQGVSGILSLELSWPGREVGHSPPSSAEVKNTWR